MKAALRVAVLVAVPLLMGADGGCDGMDMPTARQIDLYVPTSLRTCKDWPKSPGAKASNRQTSRYIVAAYDAYRSCKGNVVAIDRILTQYEGRIEKLRRGL